MSEGEVTDYPSADIPDQTWCVMLYLCSQDLVCRSCSLLYLKNIVQKILKMQKGTSSHIQIQIETSSELYTPILIGLN